VENKTADFNGTTIRYITFGNDGNDLLLNTEDVCKVLGITEHRGYGFRPARGLCSKVRQC